MSSINATAKTHKPSGEAALRIIHSNARHPFNPMLKWVSQRIQLGTRALPHLLLDSADLRSKLQHLRLPSGVRLIKLDVKDYFMSGRHDALIEEAPLIIADPSERQLIKDCLSFTLFSQYVRVPDHNVDNVWQVMIGSGMGLRGSGEISDSCLYSLSERGFALDPDVMREHGVLYYARYKDDILVLHAGPNKSLGDWLAKFRQKCKFFKIKLESLSSHSATMMDLRLFKGPRFQRCGCLDTDLYTKPSNIRVVLAATSMHATAIHKTWPWGQVTRFHRLCNNTAGFIEAKSQLVASLVHGGGDIATAESISQCKVPRQPNARRRHDLMYSWLVLPFRFIWQRANFSQVLAKCNTLFPSSFLTRLSWRKGNKTLYQRLSSNSRISAAGGVGRW